MVGYKLFTPEWTAIHGKGGVSHPYQYTVGESYEEAEAPHAHRNGFHFCRNLADCFNHYAIDCHNRIGLIEAYGEIDKEINTGIYATNKMKIIREIPWREAIHIVENALKGEEYDESFVERL